MAATTGFQVCAVIFFLRGYTGLPRKTMQGNTSMEKIENFAIIAVEEEYVECTWRTREKCSAGTLTLFYKFQNLPWKKCLNYLHGQDCNIGCRFNWETIGQITVSIRDSSVIPEVEIFQKTLMIYNYIKPNLPANVTIRWEKNTVIITCSKPKAIHCFKFELHYKSKYDEEWQSREKSCCNITVSGFDLEKCYSFRVRMIRHICSTHPYPGEWSSITFWKNGTSADSCSDDEFLSTNVILIISLVASQAMFILLYCICKVKRMQVRIMPLIPDPKYVFSGLFDDHNGNFQAWLDELDNVVKPAKVACLEKECVIDEELREEDENQFLRHSQ
ncbi:cytokine receptor-like factor 2 [Rhinatrema bivittatum]|uniref:cytokine receptor-like factor 2 n=1 Tax=Rhinatrema bivittatum TaxID=194408 RepID=UPI00112E4958|nr:cytokine receptor-like factor 2 [Rhinatrema bivittatum]